MTSLVVVGSGIAGLTTALRAASLGAEVTVVAKAALEDTATAWAQGGIAAVTFPDDSVEDHVRDTLAASAGLGDAAAAGIVAAGGAEVIAELISHGVVFDTDSSGRFVRGLEAAHSYPRVIHAGGDATGLEIQRALSAAARAHDGIVVREHEMAADVVLDGGRARGIRLLRGGVLHADAVVLATGGAGALFAHTTNPSVATGDGLAMALRAGAAVADLEFVQFHPTVLHAPGAFLVSEAVRGEGALLVDETGHRFVLDVHPDGELAPRDVVARAIADAMAQGRQVFLDATSLRGGTAGNAAFLASRFPTIDRAVRAAGIDWSAQRVPVTPAAHYLMGGVVTDLDGRTSIPGLFAAGETARTGLHGANRLASNSLLEGAVFGSRVGAAATSAPRSRGRVGPDAAGPGPLPRQAPPRADLPFSRRALQRLLWDHAGLRRDAIGLTRAASTVASWRASRAAQVADAAAAEDDNLLLVAEHLLAAAHARRGSVGAHVRSDDPSTSGKTAPLPEATLIGAPC
ncbi:L-aspartate oxidase [Microbacterium sp. SSW1-59]|uniref:L-aspartate oxidase n=1 Tax=Microbacterium xanthum TaxID=3079794 RepID=UPI002AD3B6EB|nr:L-aspartate oxidase [Microbacterium sp. SSW1-59]MDZ8202177.1 L-aspartate oxidase [Microbacterium sp. SSW1-59]